MKSKKQSLLRFYRDIEELPVWNFNKVLETGALFYLFITDDYYQEFNPDEIAKLSPIWDRIFTAYMERFGLTEEVKALLRKRKSIAMLKIKMLEKEDFGLQAAINIEEHKLEKELAGKPTARFEETVAYMEQTLKMPIDIKRVSVVMFYTHLEMMQKENKRKIELNQQQKLKANG